MSALIEQTGGPPLGVGAHDKGVKNQYLTPRGELPDCNLLRRSEALLRYGTAIATLRSQ
jgi:hypothetical protein